MVTLAALAVAAPAFATPPSSTITAPHSPAHLTRQPNAMELVWRRYAAHPRQDEHIVLDCVIDTDQRLKPCDVVELAPQDKVFEQAALAALTPARMAPPVENGAPVPTAHVEVTIDYLAESGAIRWMWIYQ